MAKVLARFAPIPLPDAAELLRRTLVVGCAMALILAGPAVPSAL